MLKWCRKSFLLLLKINHYNSNCLAMLYLLPFKCTNPQQVKFCIIMSLDGGVEILSALFIIGTFCLKRLLSGHIVCFKLTPNRDTVIPQRKCILTSSVHTHTLNCWFYCWLIHSLITHIFPHTQSMISIYL